MILTKLCKIFHWLKMRRMAFQSIGDNVQICQEFFFTNSTKLSIGDNVYIGPNATISGGGNVLIGSGTIIGPKLTIYTANHRYENATAIPYDDVIIIKPVSVGDNVWIGGNVIILPGVSIGEGSIAAAGSVLVKNIPPFCVVGGNPAKVLKTRNAENYNNLKKAGRIYFKLKKQGQMKPHFKEDII